MFTKIHESLSVRIVLVLVLFLAALAAVLAAVPVQAGTVIIFVKSNAGGANNGGSWADAYTDLQSALAVAAPGNEIWVAAGIYKPTKGGDYTISFNLKDGVAMYGGFAGTETVRVQRNPAVSVTILSGDIGVAGDKNDNSLRVVVGENLSSTTALDGFTITGGNAFASDPYHAGGGLHNSNGSPTLANLIIRGNSAGSGGGIYNLNGSPSLVNVTFQDNATPGGSGGGMYNRNSSPTLTNVTFIGNSADTGGGMYNDEGSAPVLRYVTFVRNGAFDGGGMLNNAGSNPTLENVSFDSNTAINGGGMTNYSSNPILTRVTFSNNTITAYGDDYGGGMRNESSNPVLTDVSFIANSGKYGGGMSNFMSSPQFKNVTFSGNTASVGGGMYNWRNSYPYLVNATFSDNSAINSGGGIANTFSSAIGLTNVTMKGNSAWKGGGIYEGDNAGSDIRNSIIYWNPGGEIVSGNVSPAVTDSIVYGGYPGWGNLNEDPMLGPLQNNGGFTQTMALHAGSPAIDAGSYANCARTDQRGVTRPQGSNCDMGAYEFDLSNITITVGTKGMGTYDLVAIPSLIKNFDSLLDGPVKVKSTGGEKIFASQRVFYGNSFNELMGYPSDQFTTEYWFPWYDQVYMQTWILVGNPSTTQTAYVNIYINGVQQKDQDGNVKTYEIAPGDRVTPQFPGIVDGPVQVVSVSGPNTNTPLPIFASERSLYGDSFNEVMGYPSKKFTTEYWFPWYDQQYMQSWILVGNPSTSQTAYVDIYIGGLRQKDLDGNAMTYTIKPGQRIVPQFPGVLDGPVNVVSVIGPGISRSTPIFTSERSLYGTSFNEVMGYPSNQFTTEYNYTWYDNQSMQTWVLVGNPSDNQTAYVDIYIGGQRLPDIVSGKVQTYVLKPGERITPQFNANTGPVRVVSVTGPNTTIPVKVFTSERSLYCTSFNEMMGYPTNQLSSEYWFTWYDSIYMRTDILVGKP